MKPQAYNTPKMAMSRLTGFPARNATMRMDGIGNLPKSTSRAAAIKPKVAAGNNAKAKKLPNTGINELMDNTAMNMKNKPLNARGCFQKARMP